MQRLRKFIEEWAFIIWFTVAMIGMGWIAFQPYPPVIAAPAAAPIKPGCETVGTIGTVIIGHCIDQNGNEFEANSAGMMLSVGN